MAYYYKLEDCLSSSPCSKDLFKFTFPDADATDEGPCIKHNFSKYVLIEFLDDVTPAKELWDKLGLLKNKEIIHKRLMWDPHRLKCRRAVVICKSSEVAENIATNIKGKKIKNRQLCAVVIEELINDICLFEKQIRKYGDSRTQEKLVYVSNLSKTRGQAALVQFLREKFMPFGSVLSVLVSTDNDGLALGEAVIRFAYFSEAFASELALDEFVIGKERLHVTMQHNVLLSQCDLRVRLRDGLKEYHHNTIIHSAAKRFKKDKYKTVESHGGCKSDESSNSIEFHPGDNGILSHCEFASPTQDIRKSLDMHMGGIMENVEQTPIEDSPSTQSCSNKRSYSECVLETTLDDTVSQIDGAVSVLQTNSVVNSSSSDQSVSSKIFGWMKSFVWRSNPEASIQMKPGSNNSSPESVLPDGSEHSSFVLNELQLDMNKKVSKSNQFSSKLKDKSEINTEAYSKMQSNCKSFLSESFHDENQENISTQQSKLSHNYQSKISMSSNKKDMKLNTSSVKRQGNNRSPGQKKSGTLQNINPEKIFGALTHLDKIIEKSTDEIFPQTTSSFSSKDQLQQSNLHVSQKRPLSSRNHSLFSSSAGLEQNVKLGKSVTKSIIFDTGQTALPSISDQLNFSSENRKTASTVKLKNKISSVESAPLQMNNGSQVATKDSGAPSVQPGSSDFITGNNPIKDWLKKHLNETTNNRMTATKEKPEGIIFATMSKDILVTVGCSHMTCDTCYPSGSDIIFGL